MACHLGLNTGVKFTVLLTPSPARDNLITFYNQNREEVNCDFEKEEEEEKSLNMLGISLLSVSRYVAPDCILF